MNIEHGMVTMLTFWPADDIKAAFNRVNAAKGTPNEIEELRLFVRTMNFFYDLSSETRGDISSDEIATLYDTAKKGLGIELS